MDDRSAVQALVSDLHRQIDQLKPRGIKDRAGNDYRPSYYLPALERAVAEGGLGPVEFVRGYLYRKASDGFEKLVDANSLDLACEWLVADADKPYAHLFTEEDRRVARDRLAPHMEAIEARKRQTERSSELPTDLGELEKLSEDEPPPEEAVAVNSAILNQKPGDKVAMLRLARAHQALRHDDEARELFEAVLRIDSSNSIARDRLAQIARRHRA